MENQMHITRESERPVFGVEYGLETKVELLEKYFKVIKVLSGHAVLQSNDDSIRIDAGEYAFVSPGGFSRITMTPDKDCTFRLIGMNFSDSFIAGLHAGNRPRPHAGPSEKCFEKMSPCVWIDALFSSIGTYISESGYPDSEIIRMKMDECVHILYSHYPALYSTLVTEKKTGRTDLEIFLKENHRYNASLKRFAELSGRSLSTFRRDCIRKYGKSPAKVLMEMRLDDARRMLEEGMHPVDIFYETGFETLAHFSRKFKERFGISPSRYIRSIRGKA